MLQGRTAKDVEGTEPGPLEPPTDNNDDPINVAQSKDANAPRAADATSPERAEDGKTTSIESDASDAEEDGSAAPGEAASHNNTSTNVLHDQDDNGSVFSCDSDNSLVPGLPNTDTVGAFSSHMPSHAPSSDAVGCSNEKTALPQE